MHWAELTPRFKQSCIALASEFGTLSVSDEPDTDAPFAHPEAPIAKSAAAPISNMELRSCVVTWASSSWDAGLRHRMVPRRSMVPFPQRGPDRQQASSAAHPSRASEWRALTTCRPLRLGQFSTVDGRSRDRSTKQLEDAPRSDASVADDSSSFAWFTAEEEVLPIHRINASKD